MSQLQNARDALSAAVALQAALLRMREVIGDPLSTANACERHAAQLTGEMFKDKKLTDDELKNLTPQLQKSTVLIDKVYVVLGDRIMKAQDIYQSLVDSGVPERQYLRHDIVSTLSKNSGGKGRGVFTRVRHGWWKRSQPDDAEVSLKLPKGLLVRKVYEALGKEALAAPRVSDRLMALGDLKPDQCSTARISAVLNQHTSKGFKCFERVRSGVYKCRKGHEPAIETPMSVVIDSLCTILRSGPLPALVLHEKFCERYPHHRAALGPRYMREIIRGNTGKYGRGVFVQVGKHGVGLAEPDLLEQLMKVMGSGDALTAVQVTERIGDIGKAFPLDTVSVMLRRYSGFGMPFRHHEKPGVYVKNHDYKKGQLAGETR